MPPLSAASKSKGRPGNGRRSRSRNTTPSSQISTGTAAAGPSTTPYLELDSTRLLVAPHPQYADVLKRLEGRLGDLDATHLHQFIEQLKQLSHLAEKRSELCEQAIRLLKDHKDEAEERERTAEQTRRTKGKKELQDAETASRNAKAKKRKDRAEGTDSVEIKHEDVFGLEKPKAVRAIGTPTPVDMPSPSKRAKLSPSTSSLSDVAKSPEPVPGLAAHASPAKSDVSMADMEENRVIHNPPPVPQHGFFPDPLAPDPVIYHIREITPGMTDEEKKEIYSVTAFPKKDLSDQIAGTPPDKDFSNAKPTNQVAANTFLTYVEPYVRPLTEEDMAFLREKGDRTTPFLAVPRGKRHYSEIWAEEDGVMSVDSTTDRFPPNQARGSLEQINNENIETDQVSQGPLASRLLSLLRFEHRPPPGETTGATNGDMSFMNGDENDTMDLDGLTNGHDDSDKPLPAAATVADLVAPKSTIIQKLDYVQADERIKLELRHLGLLGQDEVPDYDGHHDDDISERLRLLQTELKRVMITNGARKQRLLDVAKERLAYQEYSTIHEDLDSQVQQAYLKRTRTLGKTKKGGSGGSKPRTGGGAAGAAGSGIATSRARDIGDNARMLMDRRKRWQDCIGPVFKDMKQGVPSKDSSLFEPKIMEAYEKAELEAFEDEAE